ncbi:MAG: hypothetical protein HPY69_12040 [Armatimonadetes bacterium]|nr:hypothetical protein [Armatimonadota bacterium]
MSTEQDGAVEGLDLAADQADRRQLFEARDLALGGLLGALAITLPLAFHAMGPGAGPIFLPMYLPILALGLLASWEVALAVGLAAPLLSAVLTGMPPLAPPIALLMAFELAVLATAASLARSRGLPLMAAVVFGLLASRLAGMLALLTVGRALGYDRGLLEYGLLSLAVAWPGMLLQLTVVPGAVAAIERVSLIGSRWKKATA